MLLKTSIFKKIKKDHQNVLFQIECKTMDKSQDGRGFPWAGRAAPGYFPRALPSGTPSEQPTSFPVIVNYPVTYGTACTTDL